VRVPLRWLAEWIDLPETPALVAALTQGGLEIESAERIGPDLSGVRVGRVAERLAHPNADRLSLCRVELGEGPPIEIVCGAPNVAAGQKVAVALPGTVLPDGTRLAKAKIRGVVSNGMICSARELGLSAESEGILVLPADAPLGAPVEALLGAGDTVLEIALTPNRGDCASLLGIAREVRAHFGGELREPPTQPEEEGEPARASWRVEIADPAGCPRYVARLVRGVSVGPSPAWLAKKLEAAGMRPINVVVDVTNLVLLELGQPLHAFDAAKLRGGAVRVRSAAADEKIALLDGTTRALAPGDLVIADADRAIALAGVMGGAETEVRGETTDVLLESAQFDPVRVRRTARRLGISTEASYSFERGIDPAGVRRAADRAARLLAELAGASVAPGAVEAGAPLPGPTEIALDPERVNRLLGSALSRGQVVELLAKVGVAAVDAGSGALACRIPSYRNDLARPVDLVEEVARIHGYDRIPTTLPSERLVPVVRTRSREVAERARDALCGAGLVECMTLPMTSDGALERLGLEAGDPRRRAVRLANPLVDEESLLRTTLVPSLLGVVRENRSRQLEQVRIFEISHVFRARGAGELPDERVELGVVITAAGERLWEGAERAPLFFELKGVAESLLRGLGCEARFRAAADEPFLHPAASAAIEIAGERVGALGELHPEVAARFDLDAPCGVLVLDLDAVAAQPPATPRYREVSRQPSVRRDLAVLLAGDCAAGPVLDAIRATAGPQLVSVEVFDRYEGRGVPEGRVSVAFRLVFQRADRTLTDAEVARSIERVVAMLADRFGGELRQGSPSAAGPGA